MDKQRAEGLKRLEQKVAVLEQWLAMGIPYSRTFNGNREEDNKNGGWLLEWSPKSVSALRMWNGSKNAPAIISEYGIPTKTTSQSTYKAAPKALKERIEGNSKLPGLFERLREQERIQRENGRVSKIKALEDELAQAKLNHEGIAHEMVALTLENEQLCEERRVLEQKKKSLILQHKTEIEWRDKLIQQKQRQIQTLKEEARQLFAQLNEITERAGITLPQPTPQTNIVELREGTDE
ncbi:hypothetical protein VSAK1_08326 [Vibrio mediterranei AK1]|uniref:hypothetical protein n=1 Tax=Vibrio mediterranei TaxID=689 RepID=UPI0001541DC6|nr:hypothetical protein [Vibrio mediterranei]EDL54001.1 hypothetical protein VSAK1_08326 [Vibrio mediterranei AK1]